MVLLRLAARRRREGSRSCWKSYSASTALPSHRPPGSSSTGSTLSVSPATKPTLLPASRRPSQRGTSRCRLRIQLDTGCRSNVANRRRLKTGRDQRSTGRRARRNDVVSLLFRLGIQLRRADSILSRMREKKPVLSHVPTFTYALFSPRHVRFSPGPAGGKGVADGSVAPLDPMFFDIAGISANAGTRRSASFPMQ